MHTHRGFTHVQDIQDHPAAFGATGKKVGPRAGIGQDPALTACRFPSGTGQPTREGTLLAKQAIVQRQQLSDRGLSMRSIPTVAGARPRARSVT
jgi:hypothetical protein